MYFKYNLYFNIKKDDYELISGFNSYFFYFEAEIIETSDHFPL